MMVIYLISTVIVSVGFLALLGAPLISYVPVGVAAAVWGFFLWYGRSEHEPPKQPTLSQCGYDPDVYRQALGKWATEAQLPFLERLYYRKHHEGVARDGTYYARCFICGKTRNEEAQGCPDCLRLYENSPYQPLPDGIPEEYRYELWKYRQAVIVDCMKGIVTEEQAAREIKFDAVEQIKANIRKPEVEAARKREQEQRAAQELRENHAKRLELAERLSRK